MQYERLAFFLLISLGLIALSLLFGGADFGLVLCAVIAFVSALSLLLWAFGSAPPKRGVLWLSLVVYLAVSALLLSHYSYARDQIRWSVLSGVYKARVAAQPELQNGELKHIEWDGWGFAGEDTTVFLAFDPTDSLSAAVSVSGSTTIERELPRPVYRVHRLERRWYAVTFFTDTYWGQGSCR